MKKRKYWEDLEVLELVAEQIGSTCYGMTEKESTDFIKKWDELPKDLKEYVSSGWYFHGKLQDDIGFDLGFIKTKLRIPITGKFWCKVHGINKSCIGYFWNRIGYDNNYYIRGLVCYADDIIGLKYAEEQYIKKEESL